jgi:ribosomal protein S8E
MALTKVTAAVLEPTAVTDNISNGSIDSAKIASDAVSYEKIDNEFKTSNTLTAGASVDVDFDAAQVFTLTPDQNTTLNITNPKIGITKSIIVTGAGSSYTLAFTVGGASGTFNLINGEYDDTAATKNFIQIFCVSATEFWYSISQIAS